MTILDKKKDEVFYYFCEGKNLQDLWRKIEISTLINFAYRIICQDKLRKNQILRKKA